MAITALTYTREASITGGEDFLVKLESFASGLGWSTELQQDKAWTDPGGGYQWTADVSESFLELKSTAYGVQELVYRFRWDDVTPGTRGTMDYRGIDPNNPTYSAVSTHPAYQDDYTTDSSYNRMSFPSGAFSNGAWFFGNTRFIACFMGFHSNTCPHFFIGLPDLLPELQIEPEISFMWPGQFFLSLSANYYWDNMISNPGNWSGGTRYGFHTTGNYHWYQAKVDSGIAQEVTASIYGNGTNAPVGKFNNLQYLVKYNTFSDKRIGAQPHVHLKNTGTGQWFPAGVMPYILIPYSGLALGSEITYGAETFRAFPLGFQDYTYGVALRTS
jgi:hypothetical protein